MPTESPDPAPTTALPVDREAVSTRVGTLAEDIADVVLTSGSEDDLPDVPGMENDPVIITAPVRNATMKRSGKPVMASPILVLPRVKNPEAITLFIHGGEVKSNTRVHRVDPAYTRIVPFARDVERRSKGRIGGALLRLSVRGWNSPEKPAVEDAKWALHQLRTQYPGRPIAVVGHSMGGRAVLDLADEADVDAIVALAPWASDEYEEAPFAHIPTLIAHGRRDLITSHDDSRDLAERIEKIGGPVRFESVPGGHAMLRRPQRWHRLCSEFLIEHLLDRDQKAPGLSGA